MYILTAITIDWSQSSITEFDLKTFENKESAVSYAKDRYMDSLRRQEELAQTLETEGTVQFNPWPMNTAKIFIADIQTL
jgi:hypothetical protein